jgi:hypothetical protein
MLLSSAGTMTMNVLKAVVLFKRVAETVFIGATLR